MLDYQTNLNHIFAFRGLHAENMAGGLGWP
jgi:hypothetical protein